MAGSKYTNQKGDTVQLTGKVEPQQGTQAVDSWVGVRHPDRGKWVDAEERSRASYVASRKARAG